MAWPADTPPIAALLPLIAAELEGLPLGAGLGGMMPPDLALLAGMNPLLLGGAFGPAGMAAGSGFGMGAGFGAGMMMMDDFRGPPLVERPPPPPPRREGPYDRSVGGQVGGRVGQAWGEAWP